MMDNMSDIKRRYIQSLLDEEKEELERNGKIISNFKDYMHRRDVILSESNFRYYRTSGIIVYYPEIVQILLDIIRPDKDNLFSYDTLLEYYKPSQFNHGYLNAGNFLLVANSHFRRGFRIGNSFTPRFIELFWKLNEVKIDKYIALDLNNVRIDVREFGYIELDTWFGASFEKQISFIPDGMVKLRPPLDLDNTLVHFFFADAYSLDIKWSTKNGIKTFQAEEFKTDDLILEKDGEDYFPVRYIHAEFDLENGYFRHFDGALHYYTLDEYIQRRDSDFNYNAKNRTQIKSLSEKLFKLNGVISVNLWIELTSHFFAGNPLILEYFDGKYPKHINEVMEKLRQDNDD